MKLLTLKRYVMLGVALATAGSAALSFVRQQRQAKHSRQVKPTEIGKWESEGGNVPDVETITPHSFKQVPEFLDKS